VTAPPVTLRVLPRLYSGATRELSPGSTVIVGRLVRGEPARPGRVGVPGGWLGVGRHVLVPVELLAFTYATWDGTAAEVCWRTGPDVAEAGVLVAAPDGVGPGALIVTEAEPVRLVVSRYNPQTDRQVDRIVLELQCGALPSLQGDWSELVGVWWRPNMELRIPGMVSWQACLTLTFRLAGEAPHGRLARIVAEGLVRRGHPHANTALVGGAWLRGMQLLCRVLGDPGRRWMVEALALTWVDEYLEELRAGGEPHVLGGEERVRELRRALRATGRSEWL
jgi:hypothetical protein